MKTNIYKISVIMLLCCLLGIEVHAQSRPIIAQYFQNSYFVNPAYAGKEKGLNLNTDYSFKTNSNQGGVKSQFLTADVSLKKSGLGLTIQNQENGLLSVKVAKLTYAYHFKLSDKIGMHFGLSSGLTQERFNTDDFFLNDVNDNTDPLPADFNSRNASFNLDFGTAIISDKFNLQFSVVNLRNVKVNNTDISNRFLYTAASYKLFSTKLAMLEPIVAYTKIEGIDDRFDAGMRISVLDEQVSLLGLYRSDGVFSTAMALKLTKGIMIQGAYNSAFSNYNLTNNGVFEVSLKLNIKGENQ